MRSFIAVFGLMGLLATSEPALGHGGGGGHAGGGHPGGGHPGGHPGVGHYGHYGYGGRYYGGYGYGYGLGIGFGYGYGYGGYGYGGYGGYGYGGYGGYGSGGYGGYGGSLPQPTLVGQGPNQGDPFGGSETGMKITELNEGGPAAKGDLRVGDIILGVGRTRIRSLEDLRNVLAPLNGQADIVFINGETGKREKLPVNVNNGRIGATVDQVELPPPPLE